ncbi:MAG: glycosyltransferase [Ignavibacteriales bacterium]|nr:glycosyltransferase [Ignavibacteriales bacterium]
MINYSIIIPTLNEEKLLPNLLEVICDQSLLKDYNYEVIISDGGSSDSTLDIARKFNAVIVEKKINEKQNIAMGRNAGAKSAKGNVLIFINGDVYIKNFEVFLLKIKNKFLPSEFLAMTCKVEVFPHEQKLIDLIFHSFYNFHFHALNVIGMGMGRGEFQTIRKDVFEKVNGFNEELAAGEDFDLFRRIRKYGKILFARDLVVYESPRRYRKLGHFRIFFTWLINSVYIIFTKTSKSSEWKEVR